MNVTKNFIFVVETFNVQYMLIYGIMEIVLHSTPLIYVSSRGRVVKALDLKSNGVSPRRFESCRLRKGFCLFGTKHLQKYMIF